MLLDNALRWAHVVGACVLLGTGAGIAFFMFMAHRSRDPVLIAHVASTVVIADFLFTASAVLIQPVTGLWLAFRLGWDLTEGWLVLSIALYVMVGAFWLPVVWIQMALRRLARQAADHNAPLPDRYYRLYRIWFACGFPAFLGVLAIVWLMLAKPVF
ncbi:DUF2269 domain-containing protein [uncultured Nitratireductor sp.]|uniref:DUF2269 family protein n=1 Tax=uncultured Nitratireductor sp. TaxID=520953 RepID=UPI0025F13343|nr:DUF2269 domain-containing protein [uncultured Nitratireductor sp.]